MKEIYCLTSSEIPPIKFTDHIRFECYWKFNFLGFRSLTVTIRFSPDNVAPAAGDVFSPDGFPGFDLPSFPSEARDPRMRTMFADGSEMLMFYL